ncbi:MAG: hypothetical protein E6G27_09810 [Actinobacteria bacterium]|nr:MAG: hypothetical protein E6G27_09810 [Actinomycetota bacterium]
MASTTLPQLEFACNMPKVGSIDTPNGIPADKTFVRKFFSDRLVLPDGTDTEIWGFEDDTSGHTYPAPLIRVTEGDVAHTVMSASKRVHTIHHHGIEPEPVNDGVGHTSFEVSGSYTYQWRAATAGSYFYHCHVNTTLHVQMGLFGALVVDPKPDPSLKPGEKQAFAGGPVYEVERYWVFGSIDPRWHGLNHAAGLCDTQDVGLNDFRPRYVAVNGSFQPFDPSGLITSPDVAVTARSGQPILLRCLDSTYVPQVVVFRPEPNTGATLSPVLIASDGRPFRDRSGAFTPVPVARQSRGPSTVRPSTKGCPVFIISSAERYDVLLNTADDPAPPGVYPVEIEFRQWRHPHPPITQAPINAPFFVARTTITIT